jgi:hypothetical protein
MINEGKKGFKVRHKRKVASIEPTKPRNFVAKNAINTGAGAHKDKKKSMKQGDTKHKKSYAEGMEEKFQAQLNELNQKTKDSYKDKAEKQVKELEPHAKKGEYKDIAKRAIDRRKKGLARVAEGKSAINFSADDLKRLEKIRDLPTLKAQAFELISKPSAKPMKPEKVEWFKQALENMNSPIKVIKLMYDLLLSGEGNAVVGSKSSMNPNSYRQRFGEQGVAEGWKGGAIGGAVSALAGPEAIPVGMAVGDKVGDWVGGKDMDEGTDTEGGMAKQQLITAAKLAIKLAERMEADTQLDAWVQTKISLASDYIETVFDFIVNGEQDVDKEVETDEEVVPGITHQHRHGTMKSTSTAMEGAKVDRQAKHITKSMMKAHPGMSKSDAEGAAWAHIKHPKKKKKVKEDAYDIYLEVMLGKKLDK